MSRYQFIYTAVYENADFTASLSALAINTFFFHHYQFCLYMCSCIFLCLWLRLFLLFIGQLYFSFCEIQINVLSHFPIGNIKFFPFSLFYWKFLEIFFTCKVFLYIKGLNLLSSIFIYLYARNVFHRWLIAFNLVYDGFYVSVLFLKLYLIRKSLLLWIFWFIQRAV